MFQCKGTRYYHPTDESQDGKGELPEVSTEPELDPGETAGEVPGVMEAELAPAPLALIAGWSQILLRSQGRSLRRRAVIRRLCDDGDESESRFLILFFSSVPGWFPVFVL